MASRRDNFQRLDERELVIGSLCTGYGGLELGVLAAFGGGRTAWAADPDPHVSAILAARMPGAPNLGDITTVDWNQVEPVDVLTAGFPCQDISAAGRGAGIRKGTRSGLWHEVVTAIRHLQPALLVVENVAALRWRKGGLDVVLGDLAEVGYDAHWTSVRASDVGAPHRRERVFLLAYRAGTRFTAWSSNPAGAGLEDADSGPYSADGSPRDQSADRRMQPVADSAGAGRHTSRLLTGIEEGARASGESARRGDDVPANARTQQPQRWGGSNRLATAARPAQSSGDQWQRDGDAVVDRGATATDASDLRHRYAEPQSEPGTAATALPGGPTAVADASRNRGDQGQPEPARVERRFDLVVGGRPATAHSSRRSQPRASHHRDDPRRRYGNGTRDRDRLGASTERASGVSRDGAGSVDGVDWGIYAAAILRWESVLGVAAPYPTEPNKNGRARLSPAFVEWMMGLTAGWVTDLKIPRTAQLRALGNGVVPQQAAFAVRLMLTDLLAVDGDRQDGAKAA